MLAIAGLGAPLAAAQPRFADLTAELGLDFVHENGASGKRYLPETMGAGGCALDYDGDGWLDLYFVQSGSLTAAASAGGNRLFRNLGGRRFEDVTVAAGAGGGGAGYGQGAVCGDIDGDGAVDIYLTNVGPNVLLRNRGDGTFEDVTARAGVGDPAWSSSATFFDADGDGDLDLYVVDYLAWTVATHRDCRRGTLLSYCHPDAYPAAPDHFYRNRGDGTFEDATAVAGFAENEGKGLGVVALDADDDGRFDLYVSNDSTPNFLWHNLGGGHFEEVGLFAGVAVNEQGKTEAGMGVDAGDVDGDGHLDLVVTNLSLETNTLYLGGAAGFRDATRAAGLFQPSLAVLGFGVDFLDLDDDGDLDLTVANGDVLDNIAELHEGLAAAQPGQLFANDGQGHFRELAASEVGPFALPRLGRGAITLDVDGDGGLDLAVSYNHDRARLFANRGRRGHWLALAGLPPGTRAELLAGDRRQLDEVRAGSSYQTSSDPRLHFGLGEAAKADQLDLRWPDGHRRRLHGLAAGAVYVVGGW